MSDDEALTTALAAVVASIGGDERDGQLRMAQAVAAALDGDGHAVVQAGTGTGKSVGYLVPAALHATAADGGAVVIATATIALQKQLVDRDLPRLADAVAPLLGRAPTFALVKGRRNYVCRHKLEGGYPDDGEALFGVEQVDAAASRTGAEVVRLRDWAEHTPKIECRGLQGNGAWQCFATR